MRLRVATYNIHKCRGMDGRTDAGRVARVLRELRADVVGLQEVVRGAGEGDQAAFLARESGLPYVCFGENRRHNGHPYGNALLSRVPLQGSCNYDLTAGREPRGCLRGDLHLAEGKMVHIFNVHLGTGFRERRLQAGRMVCAEVLQRHDLQGPRVLLGDFNEWTLGLVTRRLVEEFRLSFHGRVRHVRSFPTFLPLLRLDHIYFDPQLTMLHLGVHRSGTAMLASDHLPVIADFELK